MASRTRPQPFSNCSRRELRKDAGETTMRKAGPLESSVRGVFAIGDVRSGSVKRVAVRSAKAPPRWADPSAFAADGAVSTLTREACGRRVLANVINVRVSACAAPHYHNGRHRMNLLMHDCKRRLLRHAFLHREDQEKSKDFYVRILGGNDQA